MTFTQGQTGRASGALDAEDFRNVMEHLGALKHKYIQRQTHIYKCFHTHKHLSPLHSPSLRHTNTYHTTAQTLQCSNSSSRQGLLQDCRSCLANPLPACLKPSFPLAHLFLLSFSPDGHRLSPSLRVSHRLPSPSSSSFFLGLKLAVSGCCLHCMQWLMH